LKQKWVIRTGIFKVRQNITAKTKDTEPVTGWLWAGVVCAWNGVLSYCAPMFMNGTRQPPTAIDSGRRCGTIFESEWPVPTEEGKLVTVNL
jgi:hypothetical protein